MSNLSPDRSSEILTSVYSSESKEYYSYFQPTPRRPSPYTLSYEFMEEMKQLLGDDLSQLMSKPFTVVNLTIFYLEEDPKDIHAETITETTTEGNLFSYPKENKNQVKSSGSGFLVKTCSGYFIITARHIVLSRLYYDGLQYAQEKIIATFVDDPAGEKIDCSIVALEGEQDHCVGEHKWLHKSDFAVLKVSKNFNPEGNLADSIIKIEDFRVDTLEPGDTIFVIGIPGYQSKSQFNDNYNSYQDYDEFMVIFQCDPMEQKLSITRGKITEVNMTLCAHNADTAKGMSGGPVLCVRDKKLVPVGIHVGGYPKLKINFFVPLQVLQELFKTL